MAGLTFTVSDLHRPLSYEGEFRVARKRVTLAGFYDGLGIAVTPADFGLSQIEWIQFLGPASNALGTTTGGTAFLPFWHEDTSRITLHQAQVASGGTGLIQLGSAVAMAHTFDVAVGGR